MSLGVASLVLSGGAAAQTIPSHLVDPDTRDYMARNAAGAVVGMTTSVAGTVVPALSDLPGPHVLTRPDPLRPGRSIANLHGRGGVVSSPAYDWRADGYRGPRPSNLTSPALGNRAIRANLGAAGFSIGGSLFADAIADRVYPRPAPGPNDPSGDARTSLQRGISLATSTGASGYFLGPVPAAMNVATTVMMNTVDDYVPLDDSRTGFRNPNAVATRFGIVATGGTAISYLGMVAAGVAQINPYVAFAGGMFIAAGYIAPQVASDHLNPPQYAPGSGMAGVNLAAPGNAASCGLGGCMPGLFDLLRPPPPVPSQPVLVPYEPVKLPLRVPSDTIDPDRTGDPADPRGDNSGGPAQPDELTYDAPGLAPRTSDAYGVSGGRIGPPLPPKPEQPNELTYDAPGLPPRSDQYGVTGGRIGPPLPPRPTPPPQAVAPGRQAALPPQGRPANTTSLTGRWSGNCTAYGAQSGAFTVTIDPAGRLSGSYTSRSGPDRLSGTVSPGGQIAAGNSGGGGGYVVTWRGATRQVNGRWSGSGTWSGSGGGLSCAGSWASN